MIARTTIERSLSLENWMKTGSQTEKCQKWKYGPFNAIKTIKGFLSSLSFLDVEDPIQLPRFVPKKRLHRIEEIREIGKKAKKSHVEHWTIVVFKAWNSTTKRGWKKENQGRGEESEWGQNWISIVLSVSVKVDITNSGSVDPKLG